MARRRRGGYRRRYRAFRRQPGWKKWAKAGVGAAGTIIGSLVATMPAHRGLTTMASGNFQGGANAIVYDFTGMDPASGNYKPDVGKLIGAGIVVGAGIGVMKLFKYLARRI